MTDVEREVAERDTAAICRRFPGARWMPWDAPPLGARVRLGENRYGTVAGVRLKFTVRDPAPNLDVHCSTCSCPHDTPAPFHGWWLVRVEGWWMVRHSGEVIVNREPAVAADCEPVFEICYPPSLEPA